MGRKNVKIVKGYTEVSERENTAPLSPWDNVVLLHKFPDVFCCAQHQSDVPYI